MPNYSDPASGGFHHHFGQSVKKKLNFGWRRDNVKEKTDTDGDGHAHSHSKQPMVRSVKSILKKIEHDSNGSCLEVKEVHFKRSYSLTDISDVHTDHLDQFNLNLQKAKFVLRRAFTCTVSSGIRIRRRLRTKMGQNTSSEITNCSGKSEKHSEVTAVISCDEITQMKEELNVTKKQLYERDQQLLKLHREIHKLKSVLEQTSSHNRSKPSSSSGSSSPGGPTKKCGVSGECFSSSASSSAMSINKIDKDFHSKQLIKDALLDNSFLKHFLDSHQLKLIVDAMYEKECAKGQFICIRGQFGSHLYVIAYGHCEIIVDKNERVNQLGPGKCFGELAILYNCTRTASVRALTKTRLWVLDRKVFHMIMMKTAKDKQSQYKNFLLSVPLLQNLSEELIVKIVDAIEVEYYPPGHYICRQSCSGDSFYIISQGSVSVTQSCGDEEQDLRTLHIGDYFGEQSLLSSAHLRTANVISLECECLVLDRSNFYSLIGELSELRAKHYEDDARLSLSHDLSVNEFQDIVDPSVAELKLDDFDVIFTLGVGGFGRVDLVKVTKEPNKIYALKSCSKKLIRSTQQEEHINNERIVQRIASQHQFVITLWRTFKDQNFVYFLMESALGGELWTLLRHRGAFEESDAKFYIACVIEALQFLHSKSIVYRDLKPENCLLDSHGYLKLTDFGFSKILSAGDKTWTFCGTPEYVAPEVILNRGHDFAVDFWSLGIFAYELITGMPPFTSSDPLKTYNIILRGFDAIGFDETLFSKNCVNLIRRLCRENPCERIGVQKNGILDLKRHKWFSTFDFDHLIKRSLKPPIVPKLSGPIDTRYFDVTEEQMSVRDFDLEVCDRNSDEEVYDPNWDRHF